MYKQLNLFIYTTHVYLRRAHINQSHHSFLFFFSSISLLSPARRSTQDERRTEEHNVTVVVEFAIALMSVLDQINRESFQRFRLRIGLNHGPVIAGVIGAQKPQYDIWSNTVNVASRMDSCGIMGRMQVRYIRDESVANIYIDI